MNLANRFGSKISDRFNDSIWGNHRFVGARDIFKQATLDWRERSMDRVVGGKYKLGRKLGSGSFGELFLGVNVQNGEEVAVKLVSGAHIISLMLLSLFHHLPFFL